MQFGGHRLQVGKKRLNELVELLSGRRERKGAAGEELHPQVVLQAEDLGAHGGLLNGAYAANGIVVTMPISGLCRPEIDFALFPDGFDLFSAA
jgi:hypothetical protein